MGRIAITGLNKFFGQQHVLADLDLEIENQEFVTLLGPSGCGKTTTLRLLAGFLKPDAGEIQVDGKIVSSARSTVPPEHRKMGMVFQNYAVWPHMTVLDNVAYGLKLQKLGRSEVHDRVREVLQLVQLDGLEARYPSQLSGGQQQRVALARSLVVEPSILLFDEPLSNLDAKLREQMRFELKELQRRTRITFVYVTHDQAEALALADRVAVLHGGKLQQYGTPREVYEQPANLFVADFMGLVNKVPGRAVGQVDGVLRVEIPGGLELTTRVHPTQPRGTSAVTVIVRPEAIAIAGEQVSTGHNCLQGTVTHAIFLGNLIDYQVDLGAVTLRVQADRHRSFDVGTTVHLSIPVGEAVAMPGSAD